jgi:phage shock protein PspC (stress-responsive transcriptional regulator)
VRVPERGKIAGVCAGIANYFDTDVSLVRFAWVVLTIVPGAIVGGVLAYLAAWLLMSESTGPAAAAVPERLVRPTTDRKIAGVCSGFARYFHVDPTAVRVAWVILTIYPCVIVLGVIAYLVAWLIIPPEPLAPMHPAPSPV